MTGSSSFFFGCGVDGWVLICNLSLSEEEDEDAMDVDSEPKPKPKPRNPDDLSEYNLDDYDNEVKTAGAFSLSYFQSFLTPNSGWSFQQYQRAHVLPRQRGGSIYHLKRGMCYSRKPRCSKSIWSRVSVSTKASRFPGGISGRAEFGTDRDKSDARRAAQIYLWWARRERLARSGYFVTFLQSLLDLRFCVSFLFPSPH
jgi:hypothetical protein